MTTKLSCRVGLHAWDRKVLSICETELTCKHCKLQKIVESHEWADVIKIDIEYKECAKCEKVKQVRRSY
jgi:hypothetical protein